MKVLILNLIFIVLSFNSFSQFIGKSKLQMLEEFENKQRYSNIKDMGKYNNGFSYFTYNDVQMNADMCFVYFNADGICFEQKYLFKSSEKHKVEDDLSLKYEKYGNFWIERRDEIVISYKTEIIAGALILKASIFK